MNTIFLQKLTITKKCECETVNVGPPPKVASADYEYADSLKHVAKVFEPCLSGNVAVFWFVCHVCTRASVSNFYGKRNTSVGYVTSPVAACGKILCQAALHCSDLDCSLIS